MTYRALHQGIAERDMSTLSSICEQNLRTSFSEFFDALDEEDCQIEAVSIAEEEEEKAPTLEIVDYQLVYGAVSMSREQNRINNLYEIPWAAPTANSTLLMAAMKQLSDMDDICVHLQFMVKVQSPLSLRIINRKTQEKFEGADGVKETHFLKMEGILGSANIRESFWNYRKITPLVDVDPDLPATDWTIVDFDNYLRGNPHI